MKHPRKIRFGVEMMGPFEGMTWADSVREIESQGYSTLFVPDHFDEGYGPITAMATAGMATTTLRLASAVLAVDFRHPAVVARELASIDQLTEGRLEVGVGAGYNLNDYSWSGIRMDEPRVRVDRLIEYVAVLRGLFGGGPFSFDGEHYQIAELKGSPRPHRPGGPPIFVAGGGKRMLRFAAKHADIVGVSVLMPTSATKADAVADGVPSSIDAKIDLIRDSAGGRFDDLELHAWLGCAHVTADPLAAAEKLTGRFRASAADVLKSPMVLLGEVDAIVDELYERRDRWGFSYYTLQQDVAREFAPVVARLAETE